MEASLSSLPLPPEGAPSPPLLLPQSYSPYLPSACLSSHSAPALRCWSWSTCQASRSTASMPSTSSGWTGRGESRAEALNLGAVYYRCWVLACYCERLFHQYLPCLLAHPPACLPACLTARLSACGVCVRACVRACARVCLCACACVHSCSAPHPARPRCTAGWLVSASSPTWSRSCATGSSTPTL